jgi:hypothetical protein
MVRLRLRAACIYFGYLSVLPFANVTIDVRRVWAFRSRWSSAMRDFCVPSSGSLDGS